MRIAHHVLLQDKFTQIRQCGLGRKALYACQAQSRLGRARCQELSVATASRRPTEHLNYLNKLRLEPRIARRRRVYILLDKETSRFIERRKEVGRGLDNCPGRHSFVDVVNARINSSLPTS